MTSDATPFHAQTPMITSVSRKHSGAGIASFIFSFCVLLLFLMVLAANFSPIASEFPGSLFVLILWIGLFLVDFLAFGLGIASLFHRDRLRIFGIMGTILAIVPALLTVALILIYNRMQY